MATRRTSLHHVEPSQAVDDQVRVVYAEKDDPAVLDKVAELLLQLLRDPKAK
jgi:hypothetical protein